MKRIKLTLKSIQFGLKKLVRFGLILVLMNFYDPEHSTDEDRYIRIGHSTGHKLLLVIFCERDSGNIIRIISARKATREEREQYEEGI